MLDGAYIYSPMWYNYETDALDFKVEIDESEFEKIYNAVKDDDDFFEWANRYKSYPGFISSMPRKKELYLKAVQGKDLERSLAMYLTYIGEREGLLDDSYQEDLEESISCNYSLAEFLTDKKCLDLMEKVYATG